MKILNEKELRRTYSECPPSVVFKSFNWGSGWTPSALHSTVKLSRSSSLGRTVILKNFAGAVVIKDQISIKGICTIQLFYDKIESFAVTHNCVKLVLRWVINILWIYYWNLPKNSAFRFASFNNLIRAERGTKLK